jgi:hypothetical protein
MLTAISISADSGAKARLGPGPVPN